MRVVEAESSVDVAKQTAVVVIAGDTRDELTKIEAVALAQQFAGAYGLRSPGVDRRGVPYPAGGGVFRVDIELKGLR